jgi:recombination protein RecA
MGSAVALRSQIEASLARRIPSALTPQPRVIRPVVSTGIAAVDEAAGGGVPVGAVTVVVGAECSGRTSLTLGFVAQVMREGKVCAWVDVSDALAPDSAAAAGCDLGRLLWVRCGVAEAVEQRSWESGGFTVPEKYFVPPPAKKGLHGGGFGMHPRDEQKGLEEAVSGLLQGQVIEPRCAEPQRRVRVEKQPVEAVAIPTEKNWTPCAGASPSEGSRERRWAARRKKHWDRMDQGLRAMDLLLQAGGFGAVVLDLGSMAPEHVSRIPLATWFRYRAAAERTQTCVVLLTQYPCAKSSAELVLRMDRGVIRTQGGSVLTGFERRVEVVRRRFEKEKVVPIKKPPQRAGVGVWQSRPTWAGVR